MVVQWALKNITKAKMKIIKITPVGRLLSVKSLGSTKNKTQHFSPLRFDSGLSPRMSLNGKGQVEGVPSPVQLSLWT